MAQTKRKRRSKHRGNAAGTIETRGRTGRRIEPADEDPKGAGSRRAGGGARAAGGRVNRFDQPPTWRSAGLRAAFAAALLFVLFQLGDTLGFGPARLPILQSLALCILAVGIYAPLGYMTDRYIYNRRQKRKLAAK